EHAIKRFPRGVVKAVQPSLISLSQVTECGTLYTLDEIKAISAIARHYEIGMHLDGARFANALISLGCTPAELTWKSGIDVVSFGATKNGALACEAVIFFDPAKAADFEFRRKRSGHTLSKGRLFGALEQDHWLNNARHANDMANTLSAGFAKTAGIRMPWKTEANEVFAIVPKRIADALSNAKIFAAPWYTQSVSLPHNELIKDDERFLRFVTSYATKAEEIEMVLKTVRAA
ncbi:MAG: low specificity L-threonine aldolase, partial [Alphaproteobacteria bacterium]|nr:low specificity L-threonine aldolase [Alphaproteobacteria bacterium]